MDISILFLGCGHILGALCHTLLILAELQEVQPAYFTAKEKLRPQFSAYWHMVNVKQTAHERWDCLNAIPEMCHGLEFIRCTAALLLCPVFGFYTYRQTDCAFEHFTPALVCIRTAFALALMERYCALAGFSIIAAAFWCLPIRALYHTCAIFTEFKISMDVRGVFSCQVRGDKLYIVLCCCLFVLCSVFYHDGG